VLSCVVPRAARATSASTSELCGSLPIDSEGNGWSKDPAQSGSAHFAVAAARTRRQQVRTLQSKAAADVVWSAVDIIRVFIENPAGLRLKHSYDEKKRVLESVATVSRPYPYHYGFILNTSAADGDHLDCFVLSNRKFSSGDIVDCVVLGLMEQWEDGFVDHNIIACPAGETASVAASVRNALVEFVAHVFDHRPGKVIRAGAFLDATAARRHISECTD
jgi:inorganic pyrophosphatase